MPITIFTTDGRYTLDVPDGTDPKDEIQRIKNGDGEYASGWLVARGQEHIRISDVVRMRPYDRS